MDEGFRLMTDYERAIIERLIQPEFQGKQEIAQQLADCMVRADNTSLEIRTNVEITANVSCWIPVEAEALDEDGAYLDYQLMVGGGKVGYLDILKEGLPPIIRHPPPSELKVFVNWIDEKGIWRQQPA